jgi:hypothetical protein
VQTIISSQQCNLFLASAVGVVGTSGFAATAVAGTGAACAGTDTGGAFTTGDTAAISAATTPAPAAPAAAPDAAAAAAAAAAALPIANAVIPSPPRALALPILDTVLQLPITYAHAHRMRIEKPGQSEKCSIDHAMPCRVVHSSDPHEMPSIP